MTEPFVETKASPKTVEEQIKDILIDEVSILEDRTFNRLERRLLAVVNADRAEHNKQVEIWIKDLEDENDRILKTVNEDQQLPDAQAQAILKLSYFNNGYIQGLKDTLRLKP